MILTEAYKNNQVGEDVDYIYTIAERTKRKREKLQTKNKSQFGFFFYRFRSRFFSFSLGPSFSMLYFIWEIVVLFCSLGKKNYCKRRKNCNLINKFVIFVVFVSGGGVCASLSAEIYVRGKKIAQSNQKQLK